MAFTLSVIRTAIYDQLRANLDREVNVDVDGQGMPAPRVVLELDDPPAYFGTFGANGVARVRMRLTIDPGGVDQSAVIRLDDLLSVGTGNNSSVIDALMVDQTFGGVLQGFEFEPDEYDPDNVTASFILNFIALKQGANV